MFDQDTHSPVMVFFREQQQKQPRAANNSSSRRGIPMPRTSPKINDFLSSIVLAPDWSVRLTLFQSEMEKNANFQENLMTQA